MITLPKIIAHRGASGIAPENTLISMRIAKQHNAQMVEFDVKQTKDGALIIMHDSNVQRTTDGFGNVADLTLEQIKKLDAGCFFNESFKGEKVPTLAEMFQVLEETCMMANIEIKPCPNTDEILAKNVILFIQKNWPLSLPPPLISSFSLKCLKTVRKYDKNIPIGFIFEQLPTSEWQDLAQELSACAVSLNHRFITSSKTLEPLHQKDIAVLAYTVNNVSRATELYNFGVNSLFTNFPNIIT